MDCKYVMFDGCMPVIFPGSLAHSHAELTHALANRNGPVTSAGFLRLGSDGKVSVYGRSISLGINSDPEDANIINRLLSGEW